MSKESTPKVASRRKTIAYAALLTLVIAGAVGATAAQWQAENVPLPTPTASHGGGCGSCGHGGPDAAPASVNPQMSGCSSPTAKADASSCSVGEPTPSRTSLAFDGSELGTAPCDGSSCAAKGDCDNECELKTETKSDTATVAAEGCPVLQAREAKAECDEDKDGDSAEAAVVPAGLVASSDTSSDCKKKNKDDGSDG